MRLYDDIMRDKDTPAWVKNLLDGCVVIVCDNVGSYFYEGTDKEFWDLSDFPNIAPPFGRFWLDFNAPKYCVSAETGTRPWGNYMPGKWGLHCQATEVEASSQLIQTEEGRAQIRANLQQSFNGLAESLEQQCPDVYEIAMQGEEEARARLSPEHFTLLGQIMTMTQTLQEIEAGNWQNLTRLWASSEGTYKWQMDVTLFQKLTVSGQEVIWGPLWTWRLHITDTGEIAHDPMTKVPLTLSSPQGEMRKILHDLQGGDIARAYQEHSQVDTQFKRNAQAWEIEPILAQGAMSYEEAWKHCATSVNPFFHTAMLAISFMHCRNVSLDTTTPPRHIVRNKNAKRRGEKDYQPVTFKTLDIRPMREILQRAGAGAERGQGTQRALHICRGHFRHYQEGRGLFGKYAGTFWVPQHVRGAGVLGTISKDYRITLD